MSNISVRNKNQTKGKEPLHTSNTENEKTKSKAIWDRTTTKMFIDACLDQANKGERNERTLTKKGWRDAIAQFNAISGRHYDKAQFKNKWDNLKKDWSIWYNLFQHETGVGWNYDTYSVIADPEWWDAKEKENPQYAKYRNEGLPFARELTYLFKDKTATGNTAWAPSSGFFVDSYEGDGQCTQGFESVGMDKSEGSGDSEDPNIGNDLYGTTAGGGSGSIGVTNLNLSSSETIGKARSGEKRKREGEKVKKGKMDNATIIGQGLKKIADAFESHTSTIAMKTKKEDPCSIGIVMADIHRLEVVLEDADFYGRCCELMMNKAAREVFAAIPDDEHKLIFLKRAAYQDQHR